MQRWDQSLVDWQARHIVLFQASDIEDENGGKGWRKGYLLAPSNIWAKGFLGRHYADHTWEWLFQGHNWSSKYCAVRHDILPDHQSKNPILGASVCLHVSTQDLQKSDSPWCLSTARPVSHLHIIEKSKWGGPVWLLLSTYMQSI